MITIKKFDNEQIVGFVLDGTIDEQGMSDLLKAIERKSEYGKIHLYGEYLNIGGLETLKTLFKTLQVKFKSLKGVDKIAVISDIEWLEKILPIGDWLTPNMPIRLFHLNEKQLAEEWVAEPVALKYSKGLRPIELPQNPNTIGYAVTGKLHGEDYKIINQEIDKIKQTNKDINLYIELIDFEGVTLNAIWEGLKMEIKHFSSFKKLAYLSSKNWIKSLSEFGGALVPSIDIKTFELAEKKEALAWLK